MLSADFQDKVHVTLNSEEEFTYHQEPVMTGHLQIFRNAIWKFKKCLINSDNPSKCARRVKEFWDFYNNYVTWSYCKLNKNTKIVIV